MIMKPFSFDRRAFLSTGAATTAALALGGVPLSVLGQDRRLTTIGDVW